MSRMNVPPSFLSGMTSPVLRLTMRGLFFGEDHVVTCFVESVHTDQCSRNCSDLGHTSLRGAQIGSPVDRYFAFLLDLISYWHVHVSPRRDSGISSALKCGILFLVVTHSTAPLSTTASSLIHLLLSDLSNTNIGSSVLSSSLMVSRMLCRLLSCDGAFSLRS